VQIDDLVVSFWCKKNGILYTFFILKPEKSEILWVMTDFEILAQYLNYKFHSLKLFLLDLMEHTNYQIKLEAISQVINHGRLISDVARDFKISKKNLYLWLRDVKCSSPRSAKRNTSLREEKLKLELSHLTNELSRIKAELSNINSD